MIAAVPSFAPVPPLPPAISLPKEKISLDVDKLGQAVAWVL